MSCIFITGAHGFIGQHLAQWLAGRGHRVYGLGHGLWPDLEVARHGLSNWVNGDIEPGNLRLLQRSAGTPDIVFHLAGGSSVAAASANPHEDFFRTVGTTAELLEWSRHDAPDAHLVAVSSAAVYGSGHDGQISEAATLAPYSPYGHHKRMMEQLCQSYAANYGLHITIPRLFSVYGPGLKKQLLWDLCSKLHAGITPLTLGGSGAELRDWTEVGDVVRALDLLASRAERQLLISNVGSGIGTNVRQITQHVANNWLQQSEVPFPFQFSGKSRTGDPFSLIAEPSMLNAMGFKWRNQIDAGISSYVSWFRADGIRGAA